MSARVVSSIGGIVNLWAVLSGYRNLTSVLNIGKKNSHEASRRQL